MSKIAIHETAFVTSHFRAANEPVSRDPFAHLWPATGTIEHARKYVETVSRHEPLAHCLRNRFFLETIESLNRNKGIDTVLNFGCGFSMYPYLLPDTMTFIEIDKLEVVSFKESRILEWQKEGRLPKRTVQYLALDFMQSDYKDAIQWLRDIIRGKKTFILLEGVLFFLNREICVKLFNLFDELQVPGSFTGSVSFRPSLVQTPVFKRLINYVEEGLSTEGEFDFFTVDDTYYQNLPGYQLIGHEDSLSLVGQYTPNERWEVAQVLVEHMYLLKKI